MEWQEPSGKVFKEAAQAREVNAHGGLLDMKIYPWVGGELELEGLYQRVAALVKDRDA